MAIDVEKARELFEPWWLARMYGVTAYLDRKENGYRDELSESAWAARLARAESAAGSVEMPRDAHSGTPCARCGASCIEFTIPNDIWNAVIRTEGCERDDEYICIDCWHAALRTTLSTRRHS